MLTPIQEAEKLIAAGRTEEALKVLIKGSSGKYKRSFLKLSNRLKKLERQNISGTIDDRVYDAKINKITSDLVLTMQSYEAHLNGETVGTSPDTIKWAIVGIVVFIIGFLGVRYWVQGPGSTVLPTDDKCMEQKNVIYIAKSELMDIYTENSNVKFAKKLKTRIDKGVSSGYLVRGLTKEYDYTNRETIEGLFLNDSCFHKGLFANTNYLPGDKICDVYIDVVGLKLPNPHLESNERIILENPPSIKFKINPDASLISDFILAILNLYENAPSACIRRLEIIERKSDLEKEPELKAIVKLSKGNAYIMLGEMDKAVEAFSQVKALGYYSEITDGYEAFLVIPEQVKVVEKNGSIYPYKTMKDGKKWLLKNLNIEVDASWCYDNDPKNCEKYGRLYTWEAAKEACAQLGDGWRLPTDEEWTKMVDQSSGNRKEAYEALIEGGSTGFAALLGGTRDSNGSYDYLGMDGYYWTSSEDDSNDAWAYGFNGGELRGYTYFSNTDGRSVRCLQD